MHFLEFNKIKPILRMIRRVKRNLFEFTIIKNTSNIRRVISNKKFFTKTIKITTVLRGIQNNYLYVQHSFSQKVLIF